MNRGELGQMKLGKGLVKFVDELEMDASSDTALGIPMPGDNYEVCLFARKDCEDARDGEIFNNFCSGNYTTCLIYKEKMEADN